MATKQQYDQPGEKYDGDPDFGYDGPAVGDPFDPRGDIDPGAINDNDPETTAANNPSDPRGSLRNAEKRGGHSKSSGDKNGQRSASPSDLKDKEESSDASDNEEKEIPRGRVRSFLQKHKKKAAFGGAMAASGVVSLFLLGSISQGPLQLIHLAEILERNDSSAHDASEFRITKLFRLARTGDFGQTRLGGATSYAFGDTVDQLKESGIEFQSNRLSHLESTTIDTKKLSEKIPDLKGMSEGEQRAYIADKLGLSETQLIKTGAGYEVDARGFGIRASRLLLKNSVAVLEDGSIVSSIRFRALAKFFNTPSLFHPIKATKAAIAKKFSTAVALKEEQARVTEVEKPTAEVAKVPESSLKEKLTGKNLALKALTVTAGLCLVRSIADIVVEVNRASIVIPTVIQATDKEAIGSQYRAGQDVTAGQGGGVVKGFTDSSGKTIWNAKALQATAGLAQSGEDISHDFQQAYSNDTTAQNIRDTVGGGTVGDIACSPAGVAVQTLASFGLLVSGFFDAGASWAARGAYAGEQATSATATAGAIYLIQTQFSKLLEDKAIVPVVLGGAVGGNLLAYGAREAANISSRSSGGVPLDDQQTALLDKQQQLEDQQQFRSKSLFARAFDTKDYRSLTGRLADSLSPSFSQNIASATGGIMNIGSWLPHTLAAFLPKAHADPEPYNWTFAKVAIPPEVLDDPNVQDPAENARAVQALLEGGDGQGYIDKAKTCWGSDISNTGDGWDATPAEAVNPNSDDYANANCGDLSDSNWRRLIMFVFDTNTAEGAACYQGDDASCENLGYQLPESSDSSSDEPTTAAGETIDLATLYDSSVNVACAANTKDLGIADGYHENKKIKIRICALSNVDSSSSESQGQYGVSGADGKLIVNSRVSGVIYNMAEDAKKQGVATGADSGFRTMAHQECLYAHTCGDNPAASPGTSNHQMGVAVDWQSPMYTWMAQGNGEKYGFKALVGGEPWHWSPTGD